MTLSMRTTLNATSGSWVPELERDLPCGLPREVGMVGVHRISSLHHSPDAFVPSERFYDVLGRARTRQSLGACWSKRLARSRSSWSGARSARVAKRRDR